MSVTKIKGITFLEGLQLLFIAYQLAGVIAWPWWCVLMPIAFVKVVPPLVRVMYKAVKNTKNDA